MDKVAVLLMNIGTPEKCDTESVKKYLAEFLTDKDVIDAPKLVREILFKRLIVPLRAKKSALKYQKVWMPEGSPLRFYSEKFTESLQKELGDQFFAVLGMRYGTPSIEHALEQIQKQGIKKVILAPLYPQYAVATTASSLNKVSLVSKEKNMKFNFKELTEFYDHPQYIESCLNDLKSFSKKYDHLLFSFHGLPVSQVKKTPGCYAEINCCETAKSQNRRCYKAQSMMTAKSLAEGLSLSKDQWSVSFQSRLGPVKWIEPYTDHHLESLAQRGVKSLAVYAPSFVVDGLETLEEIAMEGQETFLHSGGENFYYIPCLNVSDHWIQGFAKILEEVHKN